MSKEAIDKIKDAEREAREIITIAMEERERLIKSARIEAESEKKAFSEKLKRERNERILRCRLQGQKTLEKAEEEISDRVDEANKKYEKLSEYAICAALEVLLGR